MSPDRFEKKYRGLARLDAWAGALAVLVDVNGRGRREQTGDGARSLADDLRVRSVEPDLEDRAARTGFVEATVAEIQPEDVGVGGRARREPACGDLSRHCWQSG